MILRILYFLIISSPFCVHATNTKHQLARDVQLRMELYQSRTESIEDVSKLNPISEEDRTERDLYICLSIGDNNEHSGNLILAIENLMRGINDMSDSTLLDRIGADIMKHQMSLQAFCIRKSNHTYRNIPYLKLCFKEISKDLIKLKPLVDKYLN